METKTGHVRTWGRLHPRCEPARVLRACPPALNRIAPSAQLRQEFDESLASVSEQKDGAEKRLKEAEGELERLRGAATEAQRAWDKERAQAAAALEATKEAAAAEAARRKTRSEQELDQMQKQIQAKDVLIEQLQAAMTSTSEQKDQAHGAVLAEARAEVRLQAQLPPHPPPTPPLPSPVDKAHAVCGCDVWV